MSIRIKGTTALIRARMNGTHDTTNPRVYVGYGVETGVNNLETFVTDTYQVDLDDANNVTILAAGATADEVKVAGYIAICNIDVVDQVIIVEHYDGTATRLVWANLVANENLIYTPATGWYVLGYNGEIKQTVHNTDDIDEGMTDGALNGTSEVIIVAAPSWGSRKVRSVIICNVDTAAVTLNLYVLNGATVRYLIKGESVAASKTLIFDTPLTLDTTAKSLRATMGGAAATTNPDFAATWEEVP